MMKRILPIILSVFGGVLPVDGSRRSRGRSNSYEIEFKKSEKRDLDVNINDYVSFKCPYDDIIHIYKVQNQKNFDECQVDEESVVLMDCTGMADASTEFEFKIVEFSPMVTAYLFEAGRDYYYIGKPAGQTGSETGCDKHMKVKLSVSRRPTHPKSKKSPTMIPPTVAPSQHSPTSTITSKTKTEAKRIEPEVREPEMKKPEVKIPSQSGLFGYSKSESSSANLTSVNILVLFVSWFLLG